MEKTKKYNLIYDILCRTYNITDEDIDRITYMIEKYAEEQDKSLFDITKIGYGTYSKVYRLGNKVIKTSGKRGTPNIIENNRILIPDQLINIKGNIIEINDYVEGIGDVSEDEIYEVYKDLREQGIVWFDPWYNNIGRLNETALKSQERKLKTRPNTPLLVENRRFIHRQLKVNDPVIIDLEFLIDENDEDEIERATCEVNDLRLYAKCVHEKRYLLENKKGDSYGIF